MWFRLAVFCLSFYPSFLAAQEFTPIDVGQHIYDGGWEHYVGGGVAAFDCDGDHLPELYAAGGDNPATLFRNNSQPNREVEFSQETPEELRISGVIGAYPLDIDSDQRIDLVVLRVGENLLLKGGPDCSFTPFSNLEITKTNKWTTAFSAAWEKDQTLPTLVFGNYVNRSDPNGPFRACDFHNLFRPIGNTYGPPMVLSPGYCALSMLFSDWSRQGRPDLRISNDRHYYVQGGQEQLWSMEIEPRLYGAEDGWIKHELWGMGIASRDITKDGMPDVYLTSMGDQRLQLQEGSGKPIYRDAAFDFGVTAHRPYIGDDGRPSTGWHAVFGDVQNDGLDDLFITKGNVEQMLGSAFTDPNNLLVQGADHKFTEMGDKAGIASMGRGRGGALADFNLDGLLDWAVVNRRSNIEVYENVTTGTGHWIGLKLQQPGINPDAVGAWIELRAGEEIHTREVTVGGGHAGGVLTAEHFGLGKQKSGSVRVIWPDGITSEWKNLPVDRYLTVLRTANGLELTPY